MTRCLGIPANYSGINTDIVSMIFSLPIDAILTDMESLTLHADNEGRITLPAWWRRKEGINSSTDLCVAVTDEGSLVVETRNQGLRRARALLRNYIPESVDLAGELIADRRAEATQVSVCTTW